jgi:hypothetical protein
MTVKDVFDLRRQGKIEEAYEAIRPMYAAHKGKYTSLCMFWTASDIFKLRLDQGRNDEARKILQALRRMLPYVEDKDGSVAGFIQSASRRLSDITKIAEESHAEETAEHHSQRDKDDADGVQNNSDSDSSESETADDEEQVTEAQTEKESSDTPHTVDYSGHLAVGLDEGIIRPHEGINALQRIILACLVAHPGYSISEISNSTGLPVDTVERHIAVLIEKSFVEQRDGENSSGYYIVHKV